MIGDHQYFAGYSLFLAKEHVTELHHLKKETRLHFSRRMSVVQEAVAKAFAWQVSLSFLQKEPTRLDHVPLRPCPFKITSSSRKQMPMKMGIAIS